MPAFDSTLNGTNCLELAIDRKYKSLRSVVNEGLYSIANPELKTKSL